MSVSHILSQQYNLFQSRRAVHLFRRHSAGSPRAGFSILELMLVMALLSILSAIILPLFSRARESCYRSKCVGNLRQFAAAFTLYAEDTNGWWPAPGGQMGDKSYWAQSGSGGLNPYIRQHGLDSIWCCPLLSGWHGKYPARSYSMNSFLRTARDGTMDIEYPLCTRILCGANISRLQLPGKTILLYEGIPKSNAAYQDAAYTEDQVSYIYRCANWTWVRGYCTYIPFTIDPAHPWHGRNNNYLYCDGHIVARPPGRWTAPQCSTYREMYEWYVDKGHYERIFRDNWASIVPRD